MAFLTFAFFFAAVPLLAAEDSLVSWDALVPSVEPYDDPFLEMKYEHKSDLRKILLDQIAKEQGQNNPEASKAAEQARNRLDAAGLNADQLLEQRLVVMERREEESTGVTTRLLGAELTLDGYALPLSVTAGKVYEFLLVPWIGACIHTPPPLPNQIVHVSVPKGLILENRFQSIRLSGVLRHEPRVHKLFLVDGSTDIPVSYSMANVTISGTPQNIVASSMSDLPVLDRAQVWVNSLFTTAMTSIRNGETTGALFTALFLAFGYGALHTLGPGHGKAVVISYFVGSGGSLRRGLVMGFRIAIIHVVSAVVVVFLLDFAVRQTTGAAPSDYRAIRLVSYGLIVVIGMFMLWKALSATRFALKAGDLGAPAHDHDHHDHHVHGCAACAASTAPAGSVWIAAAVGIVPCTGALIVMLFGLANDLIVPAILMVCAISLGMAMAMSAIGIAALWGRSWAYGRFDMTDKRRQTFELSTRLVGAICVLAIGVTLFWINYKHSPAATLPQAELASSFY
ncbi:MULTISPECIES: DUF3299 domain-containing protein [unclassified Ruegeria]|uniref:HoxN/HupN/NixA family nickel/cobalt transporter n=1 Tax=unclassified Ruegeria TaxID=2625375 RepID=UPI001487CFB3|nr:MULTISPECIES: DUF3299 domain-containing protein [unclassified Ruegeria]NOD65659.1 DUF3299 domain-containing protein [Ruegeria sp. HKCCD6109]